MFDEIDMKHQLWVGFWLGIATETILLLILFGIGLLLDV